MRAVFLTIPIVALAACNLPDNPPDGRQAFLDNCAACHGTDAKGEGSFGAQLIVVPPDLTTLAARNGGVFPRTSVMSTIDGLNRAPHFSAAMPEFGAGDLGEVVIVEDDGLATPVPEQLLALTDYLESIQQ